MEPFVVIVKELKDGKISLTESELKRIIKQAYNEGYNEGNKNKWWSSPFVYTNTTANPTHLNDYQTGTPLTNPNIQITCDAHNDIGG